MRSPFSRGALVLVALLSLPLAARVRAVRSAPPEDTPAGWLRQRAIAPEDVTRFLAMTRDARVLAFGDITHGTHETYAARLRLIPELIAQQGFRQLAVEAPYAQLAELDAWLVTGKGDPAMLLRNDSYWFWDTQETLDLLLWARARNAAGLSPPIRIAGVDATEPIPAAVRVVETLRPIDSALADFAQERYTCLPRACSDAVLEVRARIETRRALFATEADYEETQHAARVVEQGVDIMANFVAARDAFLAENILRLASRGKVILWGHNEHWSRTDYQLGSATTYRSAGADLTKTLGSAYFVIGSVVLGGDFHTVVPIDGNTYTVAPQTLAPATADDWAAVLDEAGLASMLVPLAAPLPPWLEVPRRMRFAASSGPTLLTPPAGLAQKFDAVLYIRTSTPSQVRHIPLFRVVQLALSQ